MLDWEIEGRKMRVIPYQIYLSFKLLQSKQASFYIT